MFSSGLVFKFLTSALSPGKDGFVGYYFNPLSQSQGGMWRHGSRNASWIIGLEYPPGS